ncbi:MAG TPA: AI-2E family transporter YdiK [Vicinamibacteria bacterium]|nr:AI-2E family transporter YdiK [Vicinamibacteria bacterium]
MQRVRGDLTRNTLAVLFIVGLMVACFWVLRPFLPSIVWATTIVVATWPVMRGVERRLRGHRSLAVATMTLAMVLVFVIPLALALGALLSNTEVIASWVRALPTLELPPAPEWLRSLPVLGSRVEAAWNAIAVRGLEELAREAAPYAGSAMRWFLAEAGTFGALLLQFLLTVIVSAILYANGERAADRVRRFARRLAGERGDLVVQLAGQAIRGVALGVGVTALTQAVLGGIGLALTGVPFASILTAIMFILSVAQVGPLPVLGAGVAWLFWHGQLGHGGVLLAWTLVVLVLDNVLRPLLIRRGADLPLLLIFAGVIGGLVAFGLVGIFVGPVVLAVAHTLLDAWVDEGAAETAPPAQQS